MYTELVLVVNPDIILNIKSILNLFENYMLYLNENIGLVAPSYMIIFIIDELMELSHS